MTEKVIVEYLLVRTEAMEYITFAYDVKWCVTKWERNLIRINYETRLGRGSGKFTAFRCKNSSNVRLNKFDIDKHFSLVN